MYQINLFSVLYNLKAFSAAKAAQDMQMSVNLSVQGKLINRKEHSLHTVLEIRNGAGSWPSNQVTM